MSRRVWFEDDGGIAEPEPEDLNDDITMTVGGADPALVPHPEPTI